MKHFYLLVFILGFEVPLFAQKANIDSSVYEKFTHITDLVISNTGKFIAYEVKNGRINDSKGIRIIQSTVNTWKIESLIGKGSVDFTSDDKYCFFTTITDSLYIVDLRNKSIHNIPNVESYNIPSDGNGEWFVYQLTGVKKQLVLCNLRTDRKRIFNGVQNYYLSPEGKRLVLNVRSAECNSEKESLICINLKTSKTNIVTENENIKNIVVDFSHHQIAFKTNDTVWHYKVGMSSAVFLTDSKSSGHNFYLGQFNDSGDYLHMTFQEEQYGKAKSCPKEVEVWSYNDIKLQSEQESELDRVSSINASMSLSDRSINYERKHDDEFIYDTSDNVTLNLYSNKGGNFFWDASWNLNAQPNFDIVNKRSGKRIKIDFLKNNAIKNPKLSPKGTYIVYYDNQKHSYFSYNINSKDFIDIAPGVRPNWANEETDFVGFRGIAGWLPNEESALVYDAYDIWKLDLTGRRLPVSLTNNYGSKHHIIFKLALYDGSKCIIPKNEPLILSGFDIGNKNNGFFSIDINGQENPKLLTMGPFLYKTGSGNTPFSFFDFTPLKAKNSRVYVLRRMSANEAPNYYSTHDFKTLKRLTNFQPHKTYNWYKTELHTWKSLDGRILHGVLYKPEDFKADKKYPVIFYYYQRLSDGLNAFLYPEFSSGVIDIPTYVSNGYLVFSPDVYYNIGDPMQGAYDAVVSAAKYVADLPFVNSMKMGIQGHSWGAIQTNYLITRTSVFAAACSSSGTSDWVSLYNTLTGDGSSKSVDFEVGQHRMKSTLWENLAGYIKNSPVMHVDKVTTPILIKHGKVDPICPYQNEMEFFLGLRRLGKKVWMLLYPDGPHSLDEKDAKDFTIRMQQFFDYYLKDKPAPIWMLDGIKAKDRGIKMGLELDPTGRSPGPGLLTPEEQEKVNSLMTRKPLTITLK